VKTFSTASQKCWASNHIQKSISFLMAKKNLHYNAWRFLGENTISWEKKEQGMKRTVTFPFE